MESVGYKPAEKKQDTPTRISLLPILLDIMEIYKGYPQCKNQDILLMHKNFLVIFRVTYSMFSFLLYSLGVIFFSFLNCLLKLAKLL